MFENLLDRPVKVVNIGLPLFFYDMRERDVDAVHLDWRPAAGGDPKLLEILEKIAD